MSKSNMKQFLMEQLCSGVLEWKDKENGLFKIPWPRNKNGTDSDSDARVYMEYGRHYKKSDSEKPNKVTYKERFRNALNKYVKSGMLEYIDGMSELKHSTKPFKMYKFSYKGAANGECSSRGVHIKGTYETDLPDEILNNNENIPRFVKEAEDDSGYGDSQPNQLNSVDEDAPTTAAHQESGPLLTSTPGNKISNPDNTQDTDMEIASLLADIPCLLPLPDDPKHQNFLPNNIGCDSLLQDSPQVIVDSHYVSPIIQTPTLQSNTNQSLANALNNNTQQGVMSSTSSMQSTLYSSSQDTTASSTAANLQFEQISSAHLSSQSSLTSGPTMSSELSFDPGENINIYSGDAVNLGPSAPKLARIETTTSQDELPILKQMDHSSSASLMSTTSESSLLSGKNILNGGYETQYYASQAANLTPTNLSQPLGQNLSDLDNVTPSAIEQQGTTTNDGDAEMKSLPSYNSGVFSNVSTMSDQLDSLTIGNEDPTSKLLHTCGMTGKEFLVQIYYEGNYIDSSPDDHIEPTDDICRVRIFSGVKAITAHEEKRKCAENDYGNPSGRVFQYPKDNQKNKKYKQETFDDLMKDKLSRPVIIEWDNDKLYCTRLCRVGLFRTCEIDQTPVKLERKQRTEIFDMSKFKRHLEELKCTLDPTVYLTIADNPIYKDRMKPLICIHITSCDALNTLGLTKPKEGESEIKFISDETPSDERDRLYTSVN